MSEARINLPAKIFPTGNFETHEDIYGKGGFVVLNDQIGASAADDFINERITYQRRKEGMLVYISSDNSYYKCSVTGSSVGEGRWSRQYFSGRYFQGPSAPTASDLVLGEKWFNTTVGSEFTYLYSDEDQDSFAWVDIDHLGQAEASVKYFYGETLPSGEINLGDKWFNPSVGTEFTYLQINDDPNNLAWVDIDHVGLDQYVLKTGDTMSGTLTADRAFRTSQAGFSADEFVTKSYVDNLSPSGDFVLKTGDEMSGTLTGTDASFNKSVVVSNSGSYENQPFLTISKIGGNNLDPAGINPGTTAFMDLPRLVLNNFSSNAWGWPKAIDFMTRPTAGDQNAVIGWRIGDTYNTSGKSFLTFWGAPTRTSSQGPVGISAGLSGEGLEKLGYFQVGVGASDSGFHALKAFRTSSDPEFLDDEFVTKSFVEAELAGFNPSGNYVLKTGDVMSGTLTGTSASFSNSITAPSGFIGTLTGTSASFSKSVVISNSNSFENQPFLTISKIGGINGGYAGFYPGTTAFMDLPRLVLNNFSSNAWGWPKAIDFMARPTSGAENAVIGWRIGDTYTTSGKSFLNFWGAPTRTASQGTVGISAGLSGQGLEKLGYFQFGVGRDDDGLYTKKSFRTSLDSSFLENEFITKAYGDENYFLGDLSGYETKTSDKNLITNGNFLVWQRGKQFRYLSDTRVRNQTKKQIGFNYFNVEHNTNYGIPKTHISGRYKSGNYNYGSMFSAAADRWVFGWKNTQSDDASAPLTGSGFYVYRGFINPEDSQIIKNSKYFCRISTSPPPCYSENREEPLYTNTIAIDSIQSLVNPTSPDGLTYGAIINYLASDDRPSELSGQTADLRRTTDTEYVSSYFDPYNTCIPITGDSDVPGERARVRDDYWAGFSQTISQEDFRSMDFGTENAKNISLRFYARGNVPGQYYVTFTNAGPRTLGNSDYQKRARLYTKAFTIDEPNEWKLCQVTCEGDKVNESSDGSVQGCWNFPNKRPNWPGLQVNWCIGSASAFQSNNSSWDSVSSGENHTIAIRSDESIWGWGFNNRGQLGITGAAFLVPQKITGGNWTSSSCGLLHTLAIKSNGTLWAWGDNEDGQLGVGDTTQRTSPVQIGSDTNWSTVSCGSSHTLAIKTNGTLWAWGNNDDGQLGLGDTTRRTSPVQIGSDTNWASVSCGSSHTLAIKTNGTLYAWGNNTIFQLGIGPNRGPIETSPIQVGGDNNWESVSCGSSHTLAIKTNGTLYAWGSNDYGQLGLQDKVFRTSPAQVGSDNDWASVSCGSSHTLALKDDKTLYAWGSNSRKQLGVGAALQESLEPIQVGSDEWDSISTKADSCFALGKGNNKHIWSWAWNDSGQLGQGDFWLGRDKPTLLTLILDNDSSWRYGTDNSWTAVDQVNLLAATGNYLDIAEVSLIDTNYTKEIYFPRSDSEIISECRKYFFGSRSYQSETRAVGTEIYGYFVGNDLGWYGSTNESQVPDVPESIRYPHNGNFYSLLLSQSNAAGSYSADLVETAFGRVFNCIGSAPGQVIFPARAWGPTGSHDNQRRDYNYIDGTVTYPDSNYTTETVVEAITTYTNSYLGTTADREKYGWDGATSDMINYFKHPYGHRGFASPRVINNIPDWRSGFSRLFSSAINYSNQSASGADLIVGGNVWYDMEYTDGD